LGSPVEYEKVNMRIEKGMKISRAEFIRRLIDIHYERTNADLNQENFERLEIPLKLCRSVIRLFIASNFLAIN
jgi:excinuclease UvrABC helicase subunit UvrB